MEELCLAIPLFPTSANHWSSTAFPKTFQKPVLGAVIRPVGRDCFTLPPLCHHNQPYRSRVRSVVGWGQRGRDIVPKLRLTKARQEQKDRNRCFPFPCLMALVNLSKLETVTYRRSNLFCPDLFFYGRSSDRLEASG